MEYSFTLLSSKTEFQGFLKLNRYQLTHNLFAGGESQVLTRERVESFRAASVLLYDPQMDAVVMIEQFRIGAMEHPEGAWILEVVGGIIEGEATPEEVARREAVEEAGCHITDIIDICELMVSPGTSTERIHLYCGRVDASKAGGIHGLDEEGEDIRVDVLPADEVIGELYGGRVNSTSSIIAVQWLMMNRQRLQNEWSE
ncbi:MAG: NUDIX domain-containing protein [Candidatus Sedimenticola sp. (ex Thyasira tokunagai)]